MSKFEDQQTIIDAAQEFALLTNLSIDPGTLLYNHDKKTLKRIKDKLLEYYEIRG